jgi:Na+-transporting methylmalonyl-CoA/oxaloacetate decarboxylase beta subunit
MPKPSEDAIEIYKTPLWAYFGWFCVIAGASLGLIGGAEGVFNVYLYSGVAALVVGVLILLAKSAHQKAWNKSHGIREDV